jgi:hypothetical protein
MHAGLFDLCIIISFGDKIGHILEPLYLLPMYATLLVASSISPVDTTWNSERKFMACNHTPLDLCCICMLRQKDALLYPVSIMHPGR